MHGDSCHKRHLVAFSGKGRGVSCPSCLGRSLHEGAANLVDLVLPEQVPIRKWLLILPYPLRYLEKRGVPTFAAAPGDGEGSVVFSEECFTRQVRRRL